MLFIILSNQQFDSEMKTNKWHVANQLVAKGHKVIFVDPPLRFKALKNFSKVIDKKSENLIVYKPINLLNFKPISRLNTISQKNIIESAIKILTAENEKRVLYIYHFDFPDLRDFIRDFKHDIKIYDCVDIYSEFPEYITGAKINPSIISLIQQFDDALKIKLNQNRLSLKSWVDDQEKWLCENCDLVFASAPGIVSHLNKWRQDIHYLPNAVIFEKYDHKNKLPEPHDMKNIGHPRIGFIGAIDSYKSNIKLIEDCAKTYPEYQFIMVGPEKVSDPNLDLSVLKSLENVHFLGQKPWEETPAYFDHFDAHFIPYNINDYTIGCHPIKYFEGMAAGIPTITTLSSIKEFDIDGYSTENEHQFIKNIKIALEEDNVQKRKARKELAKKHSWSSKVDRQVELITGKLNVRS